ncbi:MAG TPA: hypothetical protein VKB96_02340 [Gammaproteobacteria bacterium]|jgi:hypothetical protein|nr:hypothetical protein [Gammaproteobacteria bacterium]
MLVDTHGGICLTVPALKNIPIHCIDLAQHPPQGSQLGASFLASAAVLPGIA